MALQNKNENYCVKCNKRCADKWCKQCQINCLRKNFTNWTSGNEKINNFIQERQLEINNLWDIVFEWIPYDQFNNIKKLDGDDFSVVYSVKWKDGPLCWNKYNKRYIREPDKEVILRRLNNSQNINEFLNEV